jgi:hypothetical protein
MAPMILVLVIPAVLAGCQQQRMEKVLNSYTGRSIAEFVADRGAPTSAVKLSDHEAAFRWVITGTNPGGVVAGGGSLIVIPARQQECDVTLRAVTQSSGQVAWKDWIIQSWNWRGAC